MIDFEFVERLIRALDESSVDTLEIERGGTRVRLSKTPDAPPPGVVAPPPQAAPWPASPPPAGPPAPSAPEAAGAGETGEERAAPATDHLVDVTSPMVGTFYRAPAPDAPPYVDVGKSIKVGETLCIIEAMKLMNELESETAGRIAEILVEDAQPVEYGQVLFRVDPS